MILFPEDDKEKIYDEYMEYKMSIQRSIVQLEKDLKGYSEERYKYSEYYTNQLEEDIKDKYVDYEIKFYEDKVVYHDLECITGIREIKIMKM